MKLFHIFLLKIFGIYLISMNSFGAQAKTVTKRGVMDNFNDGLKFAGQMFGINTAADVANLVAKAFSNTATRKKPDIMSIFQRFGDSDAENTESEQQKQQQQRHYQTSSSSQEETQEHAEQSERNSEALPPTAPTLLNGFNPASLISTILKMIGFDAGKLGALALNAIIMVAQAIGTSIIGNVANRKRVVTTVDGGRFSTSNTDGGAANSEEAAHAHEPRSARSGNPIDWFLENPNEEMRKLLGDIKDVKLPERIINMIEELESEAGEGGCIKMMMCKSSPFIWGMQKSLAKRLSNTSNDEGSQEEDAEEEAKKFMNVQAFYTHLPSLKEYRLYAAKCEERFGSHCNTTNVFNHKGEGK